MACDHLKTLERNERAETYARFKTKFRYAENVQEGWFVCKGCETAEDRNTQTHSNANLGLSSSSEPPEIQVLLKYCVSGLSWLNVVE